MRPQLSLDGKWQFQLDQNGTLTADQINEWRSGRVPAPWQAVFEDLRLESGVGWYQRQFDVPTAWQGQAIFICFGAVDYLAEVWINDHYVGQHEGGYLPFEFDVTHLINFGTENQIRVRVVDPSKENDIFPEFPFAEIPHGKQSWYGPIGGIWQSVYLEARASFFIQQAHVTPQNLTGDVAVKCWLAGQPIPASLNIRCLSAEGELVATANTQVTTREIQLAFTISSPQLWELDTPYLYTLEVDLVSDEGILLDQQEIKFGIRTFEARDGKLWLNGRLFYMRGALDQDYYPEDIYTPPSLEFLRDQVKLAKSMGLNLLRCHIKIPDPRYLQAADEEGILIWAEVPSWGRLTTASGQRVRDTFADMVVRDWNHPSIVIWTLVNENWGTDLPNSLPDRQWLAQTFEWARGLDPHRLIVDNSPCPPNFHVKTDLDDFHFYAAMPEGIGRWQQFVTDFANRAAWTFAPDGIRRGHEPLIVSEFGNWGLPDIGQLRTTNGDDPWWFVTGKGWHPDVVHPLGAQERFQALGLDAVFGDWSGLAKAAQWAEYRALKHEIEVMRADAALSGYVITEWSDLHWESNGLVDMARHPRIFADLMPTFNADTVIIPRSQRLAFWSGEEIEIEVLLSHFGSEPLKDTILQWSLTGTDITGASVQFDITPGEVRPVGMIQLTVPDVAAPQQLNLRFTLSNGQAENLLVLTIIPEEFAQFALPDVAVITTLTADNIDYIEQGGQALLYFDEPGDILGLNGVSVQARAGTPWSGDWASSFIWIRTEITRLPTDGLLDFAWAGMMPKHVITGIPAEMTLAGLFVGWLHQPAAVLAKVPLGKGTLLITTFPILTAPSDPMQIMFFQDLIKLASSPRSTPIAISESHE